MPLQPRKYCGAVADITMKRCEWRMYGLARRWRESAKGCPITSLETWNDGVGGKGWREEPQGVMANTGSDGQRQGSICLKQTSRRIISEVEREGVRVERTVGTRNIPGKYRVTESNVGTRSGNRRDNEPTSSTFVEFSGLSRIGRDLREGTQGTNVIAHRFSIRRICAAGETRSVWTSCEEAFKKYIIEWMSGSIHVRVLECREVINALNEKYGDKGSTGNSSKPEARKGRRHVPRAARKSRPGFVAAFEGCGGGDMGPAGNAVERTRPAVKVICTRKGRGPRGQKRRRRGGQEMCAAAHGGDAARRRSGEWYAGGDVRVEKGGGARCTWRERCVSAFSWVRGEAERAKQATCEAAERARRAGAAKLAHDTRGRRTTAGTQSIGVDASVAHAPGARTPNCVGSEGRGGIRLKRADGGGDVRKGGAHDVARMDRTWMSGVRCEEGVGVLGIIGSVFACTGTYGSQAIHAAMSWTGMFEIERCERCIYGESRDRVQEARCQTLGGRHLIESGVRDENFSKELVVEVGIGGRRAARIESKRRHGAASKHGAGGWEQTQVTQPILAGKAESHVGTGLEDATVHGPAHGRAGRPGEKAEQTQPELSGREKLSHTSRRV
ncbi:hypothetical protein B0H13DRAFT_1877221 [Mycena leptocephala]|nr:hypothetical protein B0H13DRAFT_1877221 [Mycena leptocephala]